MYAVLPYRIRTNLDSHGYECVVGVGGPLPLRQIIVLATPAEILVGEAVDKLKVVFTERLHSAEQIAI